MIHWSCPVLCCIASAIVLGPQIQYQYCSSTVFTIYMLHCGWLILYFYAFQAPCSFFKTILFAGANRCLWVWRRFINEIHSDFTPSNLFMWIRNCSSSNRSVSVCCTVCHCVIEAVSSKLHKSHHGMTRIIASFREPPQNFRDTYRCSKFREITTKHGRLAVLYSHFMKVLALPSPARPARTLIAEVGFGIALSDLCAITT